MDAVEAAVAVAREQGLSVDNAVVLRAEWRMLIHLRPAPVVARVVRRDAPQGWSSPHDLERELIVASYAAREGAKVGAPAVELPPGPHVHGDHVLTFWRHLERVGEVDAAAAGRRLRDLHDVLLGFDEPLPPAGYTAQVAELLDGMPSSPDVDLLREVSGRPRPDGQMLHGDAHTGNCLQTSEGPLWIDLEGTCRGPRELDLAALVLQDRADGGHEPGRTALAAYGRHDEDLLKECLALYGAYVCAWMLSALPRNPGVAPSLDTRLRWLRRIAR